MSAKRRNENGQMRREEFEAQEDAEDEGPGEFARASDDVIKKRRIVSVSKKFGSRGGGGASSGGAAASNPFAKIALAPAGLPLWTGGITSEFARSDHGVGER